MPLEFLWRHSCVSGSFKLIFQGVVLRTARLFLLSLPPIPILRGPVPKIFEETRKGQVGSRYLFLSARSCDLSCLGLNHFVQPCVLAICGEGGERSGRQSGRIKTTGVWGFCRQRVRNQRSLRLSFLQPGCARRKSSFGAGRPRPAAWPV